MNDLAQILIITLVVAAAALFLGYLTLKRLRGGAGGCGCGCGDTRKPKAKHADLTIDGRHVR